MKSSFDNSLYVEKVSHNDYIEKLVDITYYEIYLSTSYIWSVLL